MAYDLEALQKQVRQRLKPGRYRHSLGVMESMEKLAGKYGTDPNQAAAAGILHDITKNLTRSQHLALAEKYGIELDAIEQKNSQLLHAATAPAVLRFELGVDDQALLDAVRYHTTARQKMTLLEKMLYVADFIEPNRDFDDVQEYRRYAFYDLDKTVFLGLRWNIADIVKKKNCLHTNTVLAYNEYAIRKENKVMENQLVKTAVQALDAKKAIDMKVLKIDDLTVLADYFIICHGSSSTQVKALADECEYQLEEKGFAVKHREGMDSRSWILLDYGDVIIHIYNKESRDFYNLERFWSDSKELDVNEILAENGKD